MNKRIYITGAPGTGKTWFAERITKEMGIQFYDMDDISWKKKYTIMRSKEEKAKILKKIVDTEKWIIAGCGSSYIGDLPSRAQEIIILRELLVVEIFRLVKRYISRKFNKEPCTLSGTWEVIWWNFTSFHLPSGKMNQFFTKLKIKYPKKIHLLSKKGIQNYPQKHL